MGNGIRHEAYGSLHQRTRDELLPSAIGQACQVCGYEMRIGQALHLDHTDPEAKRRGEPGDRIIHAQCNQERRGLKGKGSRYRDCPICGSPYHANYARQRTCSQVCGIELRRRNAPPPKPRPVPAQTCVECGSEFRPRNGIQKTCGPACASARIARHKQPPESAACVRCGRSTWTGKRGRPRKVCDQCRPAKSAV